LKIYKVIIIELIENDKITKYIKTTKTHQMILDGKFINPIIKKLSNDIPKTLDELFKIK